MGKRYVGVEVAPHLRFADCCENCNHCKIVCNCDDGLSYYCTMYEPEVKDPNERHECFKWEEDDPRWALSELHDDWTTRNYVHAGMICNKFKSVKNQTIVPNKPF